MPPLGAGTEGRPRWGRWLMVTRNRTCSGPSPASPAAGYTHGPFAHPGLPCSRNIPRPRSAIPALVCRRLGGESALRSCLSRNPARTLCCTWAARTSTCARDRASHGPLSLQLLSDGTILLESGQLGFAASRTSTSSGTLVRLRRGTCIPTSHGTGFAIHAYGSPSSPNGPSGRRAYFIVQTLGTLKRQSLN